MSGSNLGNPFPLVNPRLEVFVGGSDDHLWHLYQTSPNGDWSGWRDLSVYRPPPPASLLGSRRWEVPPTAEWRSSSAAYQLALATYRAACERWPGTPLRQGARVIEDSRRTRTASWSNKGKQVKSILKTWFANGVLAVKSQKDEARHERAYVVPGNWTDEGCDS